ncbi:MAG: hypothetical protein ABEN55_02090, partial [Bradymonadaceae bacterium]
LKRIGNGESAPTRSALVAEEIRSVVAADIREIESNGDSATITARVTRPTGEEIKRQIGMEIRGNMGGDDDPATIRKSIRDAIDGAEVSTQTDEETFTLTHEQGSWRVGANPEASSDGSADESKPDRAGSSGSDELTIADRQLQGTINGDAWRFTGGFVGDALHDEMTHQLKLYPSEFDGCRPPAGDRDHYVWFDIPAEPTTVQLDNHHSVNVTLASEPWETDSTINLTDGRIEITSIEPEKAVEGKLVAESTVFDNDIYLSGTFRVPFRGCKRGH